MNPYILDTALAVRGVFDLIGQDDIVLERKNGELGRAVEAQRHAQTILYAGAPRSGFGEDTTAYFEKKVRDARAESEGLEAQIASLEHSITARDASVQALAGAILQIAKQGIAIVHRGLIPCPPGRSIGSETLSNTIWQGRNQSMHWEGNAFHQPVVECFARLASDFGSEFLLPSTTPRSLARQVVRVLGWVDYNAYARDMVTLLG